MTSTDRPPELAAKITAALDRLARARRIHRQAVATQHGLTALQLELLVVLADGEPPNPLVGLLADEVGVTQPTATDSLRALRDKGLVEQRPDPSDGRRARLGLTPAGRRLAGELTAADRPLDEAFADLPADEQERAFSILVTLIAALADRGIVGAARTCLTCTHHRLDGRGHHCALLGIDLPPAKLRINCPDHAPR